ncbi:MAG: tRNA pseudouridine(38-40) synthase TruA [Candidatus Cryptobacteroides sp.]
MRYILTLSYDGGSLSGWQIQNNADTIQGELEKALTTLIGSPVEVTGAGRTDAGVNAVNYIAHFDAELSGIKQDMLCYKLNAIIPKEITVHGISETRPEFHARFDAKSRTYKYFIHFRKDPFCNRFSWHCRHTLNVEKMNEAASLLLGIHDFRCFEKTGGNNATSICEITAARWESYTPDHVKMMGYPAAEEDYIVFTVSANRFLRNMVRAIVGSLVEVGRGKKEPEWIKSLVESGSRSDAGMSVPGNALFLCGVDY